MLSDPAPTQVAAAFGLGRNASWAKCIAARLVRQAVAGDLDAARLVGVLTEGAPHAGHDPLALDDFDSQVGPLLEVVFLEAEDGRPKTPITLDAGTPAALPACLN